MGPPKRLSDSDPHLSTKLPKLEHPIAVSPLSAQRPPNNDFSGTVKKKLADSKRTGQACDRCKIRKIRCDGRPEGCSPCEQNRTPCRTTDRITGRASVRGHTEAMESENGYLRAQIAEMQAQLKEMGVEPRLPPGFNGLDPLSLPWSTSSVGESQTWPESPSRPSASSLTGYTPASAIEDSDFRPLPQFKQDSIGDNYLGVSSADSLLSHIKGTSLSVFGSEIDLGDFVENEDDYDNSPMSYGHFLRVTMGDLKPAPVPLPEYSMLKDYSMWYLRSLNPYTMLVDKPTFMQLIWQFGNEPNFQPTSAEIVRVQMMLATIKYQIAVRNGNTDMLKESHDHYTYSLSLFEDLLHGHTLEDVQGLTLISHHMRNFPKPGGAWIMTSTTFLLAMELGLHRSVKAWADSTTMSKHEIEMRKRIFWTLLALASNLSGKLGRPMPVRIDDIDVEFPDPVNDCLPGEDTNLTDFEKCSFQVGIQIAKYVVWELELYSAVYAVRTTPQKYEESLKRLEAGIGQWKDELPYQLKDPSKTSQQSYIFALYLQYWYQEFQLLLHHPAVCRSTDPAIISSNLEKCLSTSQEMLHNCNELMNKMSLDIPWINTVVFVAAIFTTLFIYNQRKEKLSPVDMTKLKSDMEQWMAVISECGQLIGSQGKLTTAMGKIIDRSVGSINDSIVKRTATESLARAALQAPQHPTTTASVYGNEAFQEQYTSATDASNDATLTGTGPGYAGLPTGTVYPYRNGSTVSIPQPNGNGFDQPTYSTGEDAGMTPSHAAALAAAASGTTPQQPSDSYGYANTQASNGSHQQAYTANGYIGNDWRQWTRTYTQQQQPGQPGEYLNTATTLMALGSREGNTQGPGPDNQTAVDGSVMQGSVATNFQWPGIVFSGGVNGHVGSQ